MYKTLLTFAEIDINRRELCKQWLDAGRSTVKGRVMRRQAGQQTRVTLRCYRVKGQLQVVKVTRLKVDV